MIDPSFFLSYAVLCIKTCVVDICNVLQTIIGVWSVRFILGNIFDWNFLEIIALSLENQST